MRKCNLFVILPLLFTLYGISMIQLSCYKAKLHPNSINAFDSQAADDLLLVQTTLCGSTPANATTCTGGLNAELKSYPKLLPYLQTATKSYNTAEALYIAWVKSVSSLAAVPTTAPANVQQAIAQAKADTATAQRSLTGGTQ